MKTLEEIRAILRLMNLKKVSEGTGLHYNAVLRIAKGETSPSYETVQRIIKHLEEQGLLK